MRLCVRVEGLLPSGTLCDRGLCPSVYHPAIGIQEKDNEYDIGEREMAGLGERHSKVVCRTLRGATDLLELESERTPSNHFNSHVPFPPMGIL